MRKWEEYCDNIMEYYEWSDKIANCQDKNISVLSFNAEDIVVDKEEFFDYCQAECFRKIDNNEYIFYIIACEKVEDKNSRVENYKKCWKKIYKKYDLRKLELLEEIECEKNREKYFLGVAKANINELAILLRILSDKKSMYSLFLCNKDYFRKDKIDKSFWMHFLKLDEYDEIDEANIINICNMYGDIACRYGSDAMGLELAFIGEKSLLCKTFEINE